MKQRDDFNRGRDERYRGEARGDQQGERERLRRALRDTYNPEPQWLRDDRERRSQAYDDEYDYGRGRYVASESDEQSGRGSYAGSGREWGEQDRDMQNRDLQSRDLQIRDQQSRDQQRQQRDQQRQSGGGRYASEYGGGQFGGQYSGTQYGSRSGNDPGGGYDNAYGGSGRDPEQYSAEERGWSERDRYRGFSQQGSQRESGRDRDEDRQGSGPPEYGMSRGQHDYSAGYEASRWDDQDFSSGYGGLSPFRVGTGMGMGVGGFGREGYGSSYGRSSGYGEPGGGYGYGASGREDESSRHFGAERQREGTQYGSRGGWDLGTRQRDTGRESGREAHGREEHGPRAWLRSFRGMGPQSYKRPDDRIRDDVYERLTDSHHIDARNIMVDVNEGNVTLTGNVVERRMRYMAEDLVEGVMGVSNINNQLKVQLEQQESSQSQSQGASGTSPGTSMSSGSSTGTSASGGTTGTTGTTTGTPDTTGTGESKPETKRH